MNTFIFYCHSIVIIYETLFIDGTIYSPLLFSLHLNTFNNILLSSLSHSTIITLTGIILYALVGTFISSLVVGCGLYILGYYGLSIELGLVECLMFGSLISATDPVATLAIFCALEVPSTLHYLVFGESIVNDAIAIVLYETFEKFREAGKDDLALVTFKSIGQFLYVSIGSVLVALIFGVLSSLIFKYGALRHNPKLELGIFFVLAYTSYLVSLPYLSGIMTILVVGILMNQYSKPNLSEQTATALLTASNALAMICETFTFLYIGFALFAFENNQWDVRFIVFTILLCLLGRFLNIVPLSGILNMYREHKIGMKYQFIMWFSGMLIRFIVVSCANVCL